MPWCIFSLSRILAFLIYSNFVVFYSIIFGEVLATTSQLEDEEMLQTLYCLNFLSTCLMPVQCDCSLQTALWSVCSGPFYYPGAEGQIPRSVKVPSLRAHQLCPRVFPQNSPPLLARKTFKSFIGLRVYLLSAKVI